MRFDVRRENLLLQAIAIVSSSDFEERQLEGEVSAGKISIRRRRVLKSILQNKSQYFIQLWQRDMMKVISLILHYSDI